MMTEKESLFVFENKEIITGIAYKFLEYYKNLIWKEKDVNKKIENSAVADRIEDLIATIKELKIDKEKKGNNKFTGV